MHCHMLFAQICKSDGKRGEEKQEDTLESAQLGPVMLRLVNKTENLSKDALQKAESFKKIENYAKWLDWPGWSDWPDRPERPDWPDKYSHPIEYERGGARTAKHAKLPISSFDHSVSEWDSIISARDAGASENIYLGAKQYCHYHYLNNIIMSVISSDCTKIHKIANVIFGHRKGRRQLGLTIILWTF